MLLGVLENIYILGEYLDLELIALHFGMQRQKFEGMPAHAPRLEARKEVLRCNFGVESLGIPELADPCVGDDGEDELCRLLLLYLVRRAVCSLRFMHRFCVRTDDGRRVVID